MAGMDWFRWHHGSVTDPKFQLVARKAGCSVAEVIGFWAMLLESASMNDVRGCTGTLDFESLDCSLGLPDGKAQELYALMVSRGLVDDATQLIHSWAKRQPVREREDDKSTERVKAFREKKRQVEASNASETPCNATKRLDEIREEEKRREIPVGGQREREAVLPPPLPDDTPTPPKFSAEYREVIATTRPDLDAHLVFANFCEHYPPQKRGLQRWRKWVASEIRAAPPEPGQATTPAVADPDSRASVEALGMALGFGRWDQLKEPWLTYKKQVKNAQIDVMQ